MIGFPNAKINLGLYITGKRPDGYHDLVSCFYPVAWEEALEIVPSPSFSFQSSGLPIPGAAEQNLVIKAYELLKQRHVLPACSIHLHKAIPMGAGLGGGSADAAETLKLLDRLFDLQLPADHLSELSAQLGSDCAFFIHNRPCIASGRGEVLKPIDLSLKSYALLIVHPGIHISTQEAYAGVKPRALTNPLEEVLQAGPEHWKNLLCNQFEEHLFEKYPEVKTIKEKLYTHGAVYASMSGSGSAVYGLFRDPLNLQAMNWPEAYAVKYLEALV